MKELLEEDRARVLGVIENSDLANVAFHEVAARRHTEPPEGIEPDDVEFAVSVQYRIEGASFGVRLICDARSYRGEAKATAAAEYELKEGFAPEKRALLLFANEVAIMTIFPYLRECIGDVSFRVMEERILLPIAQRGEIAFDLDAELEDA